MQIFSKASVVMLTIAFMLGLAGLTGPSVAQAATTPGLGLAASLSVLADTYTNTLAGTTLDGNLGYTTPPALMPTVTGTTYIGGGVGDAIYQQAGIDQGNALTDLNGQAPCTVIAGALDAVIIPGNAPGVFPPGCYTMVGAMNVTLSTTVTLDLTAPGGVGSTWIFRSSGALNTGANAIIDTINGADACNVFWTPGGLTTLGADTTFEGTVIDDSGITVGANTTWLGRALAFASTVTTGANVTITAPTCVTPPSGGSTAAVVIPPPLINVTKIPSPLALPTGPGSVTYTYIVTNIGLVAMNDIWVNDNECSAVEFITGDSDGDSMLDLTEAWEYRCTKIVDITETNTAIAHGATTNAVVYDTANATVVVGVAVIPPLIHLVKTPNLFVLPSGGGAITYNYSVTNPGTEPLENVSITDDKCTGLPGRVSGHPGDLNSNNLLESNETWYFTCQTNLTETTTNIGRAEGQANGLTAIDFAPATVVVAPPTPVVPALPSTGVSDGGMPLSLIISAGVLMLLGASLVALRKRTA